MVQISIFFAPTFWKYRLSNPGVWTFYSDSSGGGGVTGLGVSGSGDAYNCNTSGLWPNSSNKRMSVGVFGSISVTKDNLMRWFKIFDVDSSKFTPRLLIL